jgi:hypothetical protein
MKTLLHLLVLLTITSTFSQELSSLFDAKTFDLKHFIKNGEVEELVLTNPNDPSGNARRGIPNITFYYDNDENLLNGSINGYCNGTSAKYIIHTDYLEVITRGATTLADCGGDEGTDYFTPITGYYYLRNPAEKVNYQFSESKEQLILWTNDDHKLVFKENPLSIEENKNENQIVIYPNPIKDIININSKTTHISEVHIKDFQGRIVLKKSTDLNYIDISNLNGGIYFLKIKTSKNISVVKKIIKQ